MIERKPSPTEPADGFLGRWSRRKVDARKGEPLAEPAVPCPLANEACAPRAAREPLTAADPTHDQTTAAGQPTLRTLPTPSLADVQGLTAQSDFAPFMARGVAPSVRNAAMKKLFADPHFNVMDGLDTYIDDYTKPTPLSTAMIRTMTSAKFLGLFDEEAESGADSTANPEVGRADVPARADSQAHDRADPSASSGAAGQPPRINADFSSHPSPNPLAASASAVRPSDTSDTRANADACAALSAVPDHGVQPTPAESGKHTS